MTDNKLKEIVKGLNYGIKYFKLDYIYEGVYLLAEHNYITEAEGYDLLDDIFEHRKKYPYTQKFSYKEFLKEDK